MIYRTLTAVSLLATQVQAEAPNVVADIAPIHSLVARVMQGVGEPTLVMQQGASPHGYSLRPSEAQALQNADLVVWVGEDLAPWLEKTIESVAPDAHSLELLHSEGTNILKFRESAVFGGHDEHEDHDDHHGNEHKDEHGHDEHDDHEDHKDEHGHDRDGTDPHAWLSPDNAIVWLSLIAEELAELDPANTELYATNAKAGATEIAAAIEDITAQLAPYSDARFVVFHDAYQYFEDAFGLKVTGSIHVSDATAPSAARLAELQAGITENGVACVFAEPQFNDALVQSVTPEGTKTGVLDPLATDIPQGSALYTTWLRALATSVEDCLS